MQTRNNQFKVSFNSQLGPLKILPSIENSSDGIVIAFAGQSFTIHLESEDAENSYAAKLFIDMQEVVACKTFKKRGNFFGFMKGGGNYEQFVFKIPEFCSENHRSLDTELKKASKQMGEIRIVFFKAYEAWKKFRPDFHKDNSGRPPNSNKFEPVPQQDAKAVQYRSLSVGIGQQFKIEPAPGFAFQLQDSNKEDMVRTTKANFEEVVDQIVFRYSNPPTLIATGLLSPFSQEHFKYFPKHFLKDNEEILVTMVQMLVKEVAKKKTKTNSAELQQVFEKEVGVNSTVDVWAAGWDSLYRKATNSPSKTKDDLMQLILGGKMSKFCQIKEQPVDTMNPSAPGGYQEKKMLGKRPEPVPERRVPRPPESPRSKHAADHHQPQQYDRQRTQPQPDKSRPSYGTEQRRERPQDSRATPVGRQSTWSSSANPYKEEQKPEPERTTRDRDYRGDSSRPKPSVSRDQKPHHNHNHNQGYRSRGAN